MADVGVSFDMSDFDAHSLFLKARLKAAVLHALGLISDEILRLSQMEVPFVTGELMSSGVSQPNGDEYIVGYNKVYAAYMHEGHWFDGSHDIKNYSNNRKGKYLEDPIKINKEILQDFFGEVVRRELGM
jgi:hypothetical protein